MVRASVAAVISLGLSIAASAAPADTITVRADEWCPVNCAPDSDHPGFGIEIAREIFAKAGYRLDYQIMPWTRAVAECRDGHVDAVIGATPDDSAGLVFPQEPSGSADNSFVVRKGSAWRYQGPASLAGVRIGVTLGYSYSGEVGSYVDARTKAADKGNVFPVGGDNALETNLKKLLAGHIDTTVESKAVLLYKIAQMNKTGEIQFAGTVDGQPFYLAFSPALPTAKELAGLYDQGIADLRSSGRLKAMLDRYGVSDWK